MTEQDKKAQKTFGDAINSGNLEKLRDVVAQDCVDHDPAPNQKQGPQGYIDFFSMMRNAFPDLSIEIEQKVEENDKIAFAYTVSRTHQGEFLGIDATGNEVSFRGMQISRFEEGKMVERWGSSDELGALKQLGVKPTETAAV